MLVMVPVQARDCLSKWAGGAEAGGAALQGQAAAPATPTRDALEAEYGCPICLSVQPGRPHLRAPLLLGLPARLLRHHAARARCRPAYTRFVRTASPAHLALHQMLGMQGFQQCSHICAVVDAVACPLARLLQRRHVVLQLCWAPAVSVLPHPCTCRSPPSCAAGRRAAGGRRRRGRQGRGQARRVPGGGACVGGVQHVHRVHLRLPGLPQAPHPGPRPPAGAPLRPRAPSWGQGQDLDRLQARPRGPVLGRRFLQQAACQAFADSKSGVGGKQAPDARTSLAVRVSKHSEYRLHGLL